MKPPSARQDTRLPRGSKEMTGYDRMMCAIRGGEPDRVPIWGLIVNRPVIEALFPKSCRKALSPSTALTPNS